MSKASEHKNDIGEIWEEIKRCEVSCRTGTFKAESLNFHWHENIEICRVIKNNCRFRIDGKIIEACEGDIVFIGEKVIHQFLIDKHDTHIQIAQLSPKVLFNAGHKPSPIKAHISTNELFNDTKINDNTDALFNILQQECRAKTIDENPFMNSIAVSLYLLLQRHFPEPCPEKKSDRNEFYKITDYINDHFCENINVNSLAKEFYISRTKLSRIFKKYSGTGINEYLNTLRIKNANHLISNGTSITDAALSSGFSSIRTFNNAYKIIIGSSPSEHLKK